MDPDELVTLLHHIDGQFGLAIHRGEGKEQRWLNEAEALRSRIKRAVNLIEESQVTGYWDDPTWIEQTIEAAEKTGLTRKAAEETVEHLQEQVRADHVRALRRKKLGL